MNSITRFFIFLSIISPFIITGQTLAPITNFQMEKTGNVVKLTWDERAIVNPDEFYQIKRADNTFTKIPGDATSFTDTLDIQGSLNYSMNYFSPDASAERVFTPLFYHIKEDLLFYEFFYLEIIENGETDFLTINPDDLEDFPYKWTIDQNTQESNWKVFPVIDYTERNGSGHISHTGLKNPNDYSRLISPVINTTGYTEVTLDFFIKSFPLFNGDGDFALETSRDGGMTWQVVNAWPLKTEDEFSVREIIDNTDVGSANFQFAISARGDAHYKAIFDNFILSGEPIVNLGIKQPELPTFIAPNTTFSPVGIVENTGVSTNDIPMTFEIIDRITNQLVWSETLSITNLEEGNTEAVSFNNWQAVEGEYTVRVSINHPKDISDNNNVFTQNLDVLYPMNKDLVLIENLTSTICPECTALVPTYDSLQNNQEVVVVNFHYFDDFEATISEDRSVVYATSIYPTSYVDGTPIYGGGPAYLNAQNYIDLIETSFTQPTPLTIDIEEMAVQDGRVYGDVSIRSTSPIRSADYQLNLVVLENNRSEMWPNGYPINQIPIYFSTTTLDLSDKAVYLSLNNLPIPEGTDSSQLSFVVFVQSKSSRKIWNTSKVDIVNKNDIISNTEPLNSVETKVYPNPVNDALFIVTAQDFEQVNIYNYTGQLVAQQPVNENFIPLNHLDAGIYLLQFRNKNLGGTFITKIVKE